MRRNEGDFPPIFCICTDCNARIPCYIDGFPLTCARSQE